MTEFLRKEVHSTMRNVIAFLTAVSMSCVMILPLQAQPSPAIAGTWGGRLSVGGTSLRIVFHFEQADDGTYSGTMDSPDQGAAGIPLGTVTLSDGELVATVPAAAGTYAGSVAGDDIKGTWSQAGQEFPLDLSREAGEETALTGRPDIDVTGTWMGRVSVGGTQLRVVFRLKESEGGALTGTMDSPDQGAQGIPLGTVSGEGSSITITVPSASGTYEGTILPDRSAIEGTWKQGGAELPLRLEPADEESARMPARPQEPKPPFPYRQEDVTFDNPEADVALAGTLTVPAGDGPFPAAILISGSGPQNRDEELLGHKPFLVLADHLTRQGIAVLRYDDRGIGESTGDFAAATSTDFASDASAAIDYLKSRPDIDERRVGLAGHSEGALVAPIVAAERPDVGFIVLMAGPGVPGAEIIYRQAELIARAEGVDEELIAESIESQKAMFGIVMSDIPAEEAQERVRRHLKDRAAQMDPKLREESGFTESMIDPQAAQLTTPWMRHFLSYDPRPALEKVTCPTLVIIGEKDLQVSPEQNLPEIEKALKKGGNTSYRIVEMEGLNHLFQPAETGSPTEYAMIETTFSPDALKVISDWILDGTP